MNYDLFQKYKKESIALVALVFCLLVLYAVVITIERAGKIGVDFRLVPYSAIVTIDSKSYGGGTHYLSAGTYKAKITHEGFAPVDTTIIVTADKPRNIMAISLAPESDSAKKWAEANKKAYSDNEPNGAEQARVNGEFMRSKNPLIDKLPYEHPYYKIAYKSDDNQTVTITILTESPRYRYAAIEKIREFGFNPSDYKFEFSDYKNPLEQGNE